MQDLKAAAWMVRYAARSLEHNLSFIPEEKARWRPEPTAKSPLEIGAEVVRAMRMYRPIFDGPEYPQHRPRLPEPRSLEEARALIVATADDYAAALDAAGPELDRPQQMPFGAVFRADRAVCFPLMDLLHHHGQICCLQSLLGDADTHWNEEAIRDQFEWHAPEERPIRLPGR